jgi:hypothetical protein
MNEVEIPLKITGIGAMKAELRDLKGAIADATDPAQMAELSARAGELKDKIGDANEAVNVFASGSKFEQVSNSLGGIKDSLMSLDFEEANEKAKVFGQVMGKLNPADLAKGFGAFMGTLKMVGMQFIKLGIQILANPIFLLVAAITLIVVAIGVFLKKMGILETVLKITFMPILLIVKAFQALTDALGFTDTAAEENSAVIKETTEKNIKSIEAEMAARKQLFDVTKDLSNEEIAAIEASTGVTIDRYATKEDLDIEEIQRIQAQNDEKIAGFELQSDLNEEEQKEYDALVKAKADSVTKIIALEIQKINNQKKLALDIDKQLATLSAKQIKNEAERAKAMLDIQEKEALAKLASARREASRSGDLETVKKIDQLVLLTTQDFQRQRLEITNKGNAGAAKATTTSVSNTNKEVESAQDKHLKEMRIKHKKAVDDATTAGKTKFEIAQLQIDQMIEERVEIEKLNINKTKVFKNELERGAAISAMNKDIKNAQDALEADKIKIADQDAIARINTMIALETDAAKKLELQKTLIEAERVQAVANKELSDAQIAEINAKAVTDTKAVADQIKAIEDDKNTKILAAAQLVAETKQSKEAFALERFKGTAEQQIAAQESFLTTTLATLDTQRIAELAVLDQSEAEKDAIKEKYRQAEIVATEAKTAKLEEIEKTARDKTFANVELGFQLATTAMSSIASLQDISTKKKLKGVEKGSKQEEIILKRQFEQQKKMQLAMAVINGAQAIVSIIAQMPKFDGGFATAAAIAGSVIATATSLATIASTSFEGGGTAPAEPDTNSLTGGGTGGMATPSASLFGSNNNLNNVGDPNSEQGGQSITVNAIVSETQVTDVQNRVNRIKRNAEL